MYLFTPDWHTALRTLLKQAPEALSTEVSVLSVCLLLFAGSWGRHTAVPGPIAWALPCTAAPWTGVPGTGQALRNGASLQAPVPVD